MKLEATTKIDYHAFQKFFRFNLLQGKRSPLQALIIVILSPALFIIFLVFYLQNPSDIVNLAGTAILLLLCLIMLMIIFVMPRRFYRATQSRFALPIHYIFTDEQYEASQEGPARQAALQTAQDRPTSLATRYEMISKASETKEFFYIYINRQQISIIGKKDFTLGSAAELRLLLQAKLKGRFRSYAG